MAPVYSAPAALRRRLLDGDRRLRGPAAGYGSVGLVDCLSERRANPSLIVTQIETAITEGPLDAIVRAGADVIFIGWTGFTVDLGLSPQRIAARVDEIVP